MKKLILVLALLSSAKLGWAGWAMTLEESRLHLDKVPCVQDSTWSVRWVNLQGSDKLPGQMWVVENGTSAVSYALKEFVESGRLCEFRGKHEWTVDDVVCGNQRDGIYYIGTKCSICHRCRRKVKVQKEIEEWEN